MEIFEKIAERGLATLVVVTHSGEVAARARRRIMLRDGRVVGEEFRGSGAAGVQEGNTEFRTEDSEV
jgi:putative ABC transport system ATP-binding protein